MKLMGELKTAFTKLRLYWKYLGEPTDLQNAYVQIELLHREPDSPTKYGLLASYYWKLLEHTNGHHIEDFEVYSALYMKYRSKFLKESLPLN